MADRSPGAGDLICVIELLLLLMLVVVVVVGDAGRAVQLSMSSSYPSPGRAVCWPAHSAHI